MDIDIDFQTDFDPKTIFKNSVQASMVNNKQELVKHHCGVYFQNIPVDPITNLAAIPFDKAEQLGYFKIDFLHLSLLDSFTSKEEMRELMDQEPDWSLLLYPQNVEKLFQIHKHFDTIIKIKPKSVQELADCIALIRPGKRHLLFDYLKNKQKIREELYRRSDDGYYFKKSHAVAYALTIVLQLHLIKQGKL